MNKSSRTKGIQKCFFLILCLSLIPRNVFSWGQIGHRIIGEVAARRLSAKAEKAIRELLGDETLAQISTWGDFIRQDPAIPENYPAWHVIHFPRGVPFEEAVRNPKGDVLSAVGKFERILKDKTADKAKRAEALKLFVHFLSDLHNPLHAGYDEDNGGNAVRLTWFGFDTNLHKLWDDDLIRHQELSYTEYVSFLPHPTPQEINEWTATSTIDWLKESRAYLPEAYKISQQNKWEYDYNYAHLSFMTKRLLQAGVRLAKKLNDIFDE